MPSPHRHAFARSPLALALASALLGGAAGAFAQTTAPTQALESVVVTATREARDALSTPAAVTRIDGDVLRDGKLQINLSESLARVPGLTAANRENYAQDLQISIRGFGARSTFGVRGVRLYADGIPASMPDGQGQVSHFALSGADRVEVLRGPFSALYGNSSGGVIAIITEDGADPQRLSVDVMAGSRDTLRGNVGLRGAGWMNYAMDVSTFSTDGAREHSAARRDSGNVKLTRAMGDGKLTLIANTVSMPDAQDPLGLSRAEFDADPTRATPAALLFNTRKTVRQSQLGMLYEQPFAQTQKVSLTLYGGNRKVEQFQSITVGAQTPATSPGGVIDLGRDYKGVDLRWRIREPLGSGTLSATVGVSHDVLDEERKGFRNFTGTGATQVLGIKGALRRDEDNKLTNTDPYLQLEWDSGPLTVIGGVRQTKVKFDSSDKFIATGNPDDSGAASYKGTLPVLGVNYRAAPNWSVYASVARGFETPTFNEIAYRPGGQTGLNFALKPSRSKHAELGTKWRGSDALRVDAALFTIDTKDELVVLTNSGGRSTFQNATRTQRKGIELAASADITPAISVLASATVLDATYKDGFFTCTATPCTAANVAIPAGNRMPGIARTSSYVEGAWRFSGKSKLSAEWRSNGKVFVNDLNTDAAPSYNVFNLALTSEYKLGAGTLKPVLRIDNVGDKKYAGSVIVNDGNGRFFEPAAPRTVYVGASWTYQ
ncbi:MAG: TonB-dependent receptor family protein [Burkholderiaceae bacterium]